MTSLFDPRRPRSSALPSILTLLCLLLQLLVLPTSSKAYSTLSDETLSSLPLDTSDFDIHTGPLLAPILRPRVPGTAGSTAVLAHFLTFFSSSLPQWNLTLHNTTATTPATGSSPIPFVNLIATRDPPWALQGSTGRLALVAHYDSKFSPPGFIGATDSAAPCAMLLQIARTIDSELTAKWASMAASALADPNLAPGALSDAQQAEQGIQILLLDGEEAFVSWTATDSLYGARALAESWASSFHPALSTYTNPLDSIRLFVLLDLLGAANPKVPSYFRTTHWAYQRLATLETRLRGLGRMQSSRPFLPDANKPDGTRFPSFSIEDDHIPFMARGVDVLHLIPSPFPAVWHRPEDDGEHLDIETVGDWARLVTAFVGEWMGLETFGVGGDEGGDGGDRARKRGKRYHAAVADNNDGDDDDNDGGGKQFARSKTEL
ncbi:MAG: hypothetical protein M1819_005197 [Sarea resinae]|nr:MAG: hypothetical protein M1819_005197 [Sarea resinae]